MLAIDATGKGVDGDVRGACVVPSAGRYTGHPRYRVRGLLDRMVSRIVVGRRTPFSCPDILINSGAMYSGVPHIVYVRPVTRFAKPKSTNCGTTRDVGLMTIMGWPGACPCPSPSRHSGSLSVASSRASPRPSSVANFLYHSTGTLR